MEESPSVNVLKQICSVVDELEEFLKLYEVSNVNNSDIPAIFSRAKYLENVSEEFSDSVLSETVSQSLSSLFGREEINFTRYKSISDDILVKFLSQGICTSLASEAVKEFIKLFGEERFSLACKKFVKLRELFLLLCSFAENINCGPHQIACIIAYEIWYNFVSLNQKEEAIEIIRDTILRDPSTLLHISSIEGHKSLHSVITLVYDIISDELKKEEYHNALWELVIDNACLYRSLIKNDFNIFNSFEKYLISSANNFSFVDNKWVKINEDFGLSLTQILFIVKNSLNLELTFNKMRLFIDYQKSNDDKDFWEMIEDQYYFSLKNNTITATL